MNGSNLSKKRRKYDEEFKSDVLKMVADGRSISEISKKLGISESMVYRWHKKSKSTSANQREENQDQDLQRENERLKTLLRQTEMERDILKKALAIFSRS
jgi:transposase